ncbi:tkl protein kinase [Plasmopara halstedii]|uniref:Tkl protein kinase n=1 Tax=Plasmopara halstedii TaxID=4781 RepID=A0A0P1A613_PLAHL|nr:tkl protein kinase [Plasmopara halstedii]CEG35576.1 tkl protein kinase [Plasmopara halstedii]|eukprot:XP_024571945.1 tkl protein kinase [Plasmopara halstedii]
MTPQFVVYSDQVFEIIIVIDFMIMFTFCLLLLIYLRLKRHVALKGDAQATSEVILPAFEPLLWILAVVTGGFTLFYFIEDSRFRIPYLVLEVFYASRMFVFMLAIVYMCQKSVSVPALGRAVVKSVLLASYTVPVVGLITYLAPDGTGLLIIVRLVIRPTILGYFIYVCFIEPPAGRASPMTLRTCCIYIIIYHVLLAINTICPEYITIEVCSDTPYIMLVWASASPLFIWRLLRADTEYWRGMGQRAWDLQRVNQDSGLHVEFDKRISFIRHIV